jgi:hypothetical protein
MITQLDPMIPVTTTRGPGWAIALIDYSQEHHLIWVVALDTSGEVWSVPNPDIRLRANPTMGRLGRLFGTVSEKRAAGARKGGSDG